MLPVVPETPHGVHVDTAHNVPQKSRAVLRYTVREGNTMTEKQIFPSWLAPVKAVTLTDDCIEDGAGGAALEENVLVCLDVGASESTAASSGVRPIPAQVVDGEDPPPDSKADIEVHRGDPRSEIGGEARHHRDDPCWLDIMPSNWVAGAGRLGWQQRATQS